MFVRTLVGRNAGNIIEMPFHVGETAIMNGTAKEVSEEELEAAKLSVVKMATQEPIDSIPPGYNIEQDSLSGYNVVDAGGVILTLDVLLPNMLAAREWARAHAEATNTQAAKPQPKAPAPPPARRGCDGLSSSTS